MSSTNDVPLLDFSQILLDFVDLGDLTLAVQYLNAVSSQVSETTKILGLIVFKLWHVRRQCRDCNHYRLHNGNCFMGLLICEFSYKLAIFKLWSSKCWTILGLFLFFFFFFKGRETFLCFICHTASLYLEMPYWIEDLMASRFNWNILNSAQMALCREE